MARWHSRSAGTLRRRTVIEHGLFVRGDLVATNAPRRVHVDDIELAQRRKVAVPRIGVDPSAIGPALIRVGKGRAVQPWRERRQRRRLRHDQLRLR